MTTLELKLTLPDDLANDARHAELLSSEAIATLIERELERRRQLAKLPHKRPFGIARGQIIIADDFDDALEAFADYS